MMLREVNYEENKYRNTKYNRFITTDLHDSIQSLLNEKNTSKPRLDKELKMKIKTKRQNRKEICSTKKNHYYYYHYNQI